MNCPLGESNGSVNPSVVMVPSARTSIDTPLPITVPIACSASGPTRGAAAEITGFVGVFAVFGGVLVVVTHAASKSVPTNNAPAAPRKFHRRDGCE